MCIIGILKTIQTIDEHDIIFARQTYIIYCDLHKIILSWRTLYLSIGRHDFHNLRGYQIYSQVSYNKKKNVQIVCLYRKMVLSSKYLR